MKKTAAIVVGLALALCGCAWNSTVHEIGEGRFQVSSNASPARGAITGARNMALASANKKCAGIGKKISVIDIETESAFPANGVATVTFTCE